MDSKNTSTTAHRPTFARVTEHDTTRVEIDLAPIADKLLLDICTAIHRRNRRVQIMQIGNPALPLSTRLRIRNELVTVLAAEGVFTHELSDDQIEPMQAELQEAEALPDWCADCGDQYETVGHLCGACDEVNSFRNAMTGGVL